MIDAITVEGFLSILSSVGQFRCPDKRLCEGHTETEFVKVVLRWHLAGVGYHSVAARLFGYHRSRARRGGIVSWPRARRDIVRHLKQWLPSWMGFGEAMPLSGALNKARGSSWRASLFIRSTGARIPSAPA